MKAFEFRVWRRGRWIASEYRRGVEVDSVRAELAREYGVPFIDVEVVG